MFSKILIANRGEIACRVIKTCNKLGIQSVAVYSDADKNALHVKMADEAIHIGASVSKESYLVGKKIVQAAIKTGAEAIHPGYGFLSENAGFAQQCADNGLVFIGPPIGAIEAMGSKSAAKNIMSAAKVPLVPGYHGDDQDPTLLKQSADDMGYPVLLKAVAGGGGKGMRQVWSADEFDQALTEAKGESLSSFANDDMLVEKYLTQPRHVEVQVFCDQQGNGVYLFERDCSVQRRHQKVLEEAPAPNMPEELRIEMGETAVRAAQAINYQGAGTVEFLFDPQPDGSAVFYFMEMNTRLQVEHPVTEMITGQDLVEWQLRVAYGEPLPLKQNELSLNGHAFEARIYAEDPDNNFMPTAGTLTHIHTPPTSPHVRIDTGVVEGDEVSPYYDPMISKLIVWDESRDRALARLKQALSQYQISGVTTNIQFIYKLISCEAFKDANLNTGFIEKHHDSIFQQNELDNASYLPILSLFLLLQREQSQATSAHSPWNSLNGWRLNQANIQTGSIIVNGDQFEVTAQMIGNPEQKQFKLSISGQQVIASGTLTGNSLSAEIDGHRQKVTIMPQQDQFVLFSNNGLLNFALAKPDLGDTDEEDIGGDFKAPMNGTVVEVLVNAGSKVAKGDILVIMEAMKMQHTISAPADGTVIDTFCNAGELVNGGAELLSFKLVEST